MSMDQQALGKALADFGVNRIIRFRLLWLIFVLILVITAGSGLRELRFDSSNESFLPESDTLSMDNERFEEQFGNEEFLFILIESQDPLSRDSLARTRALQEDLEVRLPFVREVNALTSIEFMEMRGDTLEIDDLIGEEIPTGSEIEAIRKKLVSSRLYMDRLITSDWEYSGIAITFERIPESVWVDAEAGFSPMDQADWPDDKVITAEKIVIPFEESDLDPSLVEVVDPRKLIAPAARAVLNAHDTDDFRLLATGMPIGDYEGDRTTSQEAGKIGLIALLTAMVFMLLLFRNASGVIAPILVMIFTIIVLYGLMGWLGVPVSMGSIFVAPLLMVISVSYSIHFINHFNFYFRRKRIRIQALHYAYSQATWPCFLTALTTAVGFASFLIVSMKPIRDVGIACGTGVLISFILVMILVPIFYSFGKNQPEGASPEKPIKQVFPTGMVPLSEKVLKWRIRIIGFSIATLILSAVFIPRIPIETDFMEILGDDNAFVQQTRTITQRLGAMYSYEVMIEFDEDGMAKNPEILQALDELSREARGWENVTETMSLVDLVKEINYVMNGQKEEFHTIPESREKIAQYLLLYEMSGGGELDNWVDYTYRTVRLSVQLSNTLDLSPQVEHINKMAHQLFPENSRITIVGDVPILLRLVNLLAVGQLESILFAFAFIGLIMIVILKSIRAGLISMIPNIFPILVIGTVMGLFKINLDLMTIMIAPMVIGIAVDDTVHFFIHFRDELMSLRDYKRASRQTFVKVGHALLFTTVVLSIGFGILGFSSVAGIVNMGVLATVGIVAALMADYFIAPILLVYLKPFGTGSSLVPARVSG